NPRRAVEEIRYHGSGASSVRRQFFPAGANTGRNPGRGGLVGQKETGDRTDSLPRRNRYLGAVRVDIAGSRLAGHSYGRTAAGYCRRIWNTHRQCGAVLWVSQVPVRSARGCIVRAATGFYRRSGEIAGIGSFIAGGAWAGGRA